MDYVLYGLVFMFGYLTCRTFYFLGAVRKSTQLMHITQVMSLFITVKALENFAYGRYYRINLMQRNNASEQNINAFCYQADDEVNQYKRKSIQTIIDCHGKFFDQLVTFKDWDGAMEFLEENKKEVLDFIDEEQHDR